MRSQHKQKRAVVSKMKCKVIITGTHKDEGLGIIGNIGEGQQRHPTHT